MTKAAVDDPGADFEDVAQEGGEAVLDVVGTDDPEGVEGGGGGGAKPTESEWATAASCIHWTNWTLLAWPLRLDGGGGDGRGDGCR